MIYSESVFEKEIVSKIFQKPFLKFFTSNSNISSFLHVVLVKSERFEAIFNPFRKLLKARTFR